MSQAADALAQLSTPGSSAELEVGEQRTDQVAGGRERWGRPRRRTGGAATRGHHQCSPVRDRQRLVEAEDRGIAQAPQRLLPLAREERQRAIFDEGQARAVAELPQRAGGTREAQVVDEVDGAGARANPPLQGAEVGAHVSIDRVEDDAGPGVDQGFNLDAVVISGDEDLPSLQAQHPGRAPDRVAGEVVPGGRGAAERQVWGCGSIADQRLRPQRGQRRDVARGSDCRGHAAADARPGRGQRFHGSTSFTRGATLNLAVWSIRPRGRLQNT